jgi:hypothetical protein
VGAAVILTEHKRIPFNRCLGALLKQLSSGRTRRPTRVRSRFRCEELETRQLLSVYHVGVTDPNATWHSLDEVDNFAANSGFVAGDQVLFESGQTFSGNLYLESLDQQKNMGRPDAPITIGSYDAGDPANSMPSPATIAAGAGYGIKVFNAAGFHITDLIILGGWSHATATGNTADGIFFDGNLGTDVVLPYVHIDHVSVSGFGGDYDYLEKNGGTGILFGDRGDSACAYDDVAITDSVTHEDNLNGIYLRAGRITNAFLDHDLVYDIYGLKNLNLGYGLHLRNLDRAVIQRCEVFHTGLWGGDPAMGGPVGIDVYYSSHVLVQYNDSHSNQDHAGGDGDGFQFGEHTTDSIMQYNYSHDNDGVGYLLGTSSSDGLNERNVLRYNVSENDCRYWNYGAILLEKPLIRDIDIYNNTVYLSPNTGHNDNILSAIEIPAAGQTVRVRNNVFQTSGGVSAVVVVSNIGSGVLFQGNDYDARHWIPGPAQPLIRWGGTQFANLDQWRIATDNSQEYFSGMPQGTQEDPLLANPGVSEEIDNPADSNYVPDHIDQLGGLLAKYYGSTRPLPGVDLTRLGNRRWDPFDFENQGGYVAAYWVAAQDFAGQAFTWGGDMDPHKAGAFQFPRSSGSAAIRGQGSGTRSQESGVRGQGESGIRSQGSGGILTPLGVHL